LWAIAPAPVSQNVLYSALTGFRLPNQLPRSEAQVRYRSSVPVTVLPWATPCQACFDEPQFVSLVKQLFMTVTSFGGGIIES